MPISYTRCWNGLCLYKLAPIPFIDDGILIIRRSVIDFICNGKILFAINFKTFPFSRTCCRFPQRRRAMGNPVHIRNRRIINRRRADDGCCWRWGCDAAQFNQGGVETFHTRSGAVGVIVSVGAVGEVGHAVGFEGIGFDVGDGLGDRGVKGKGHRIVIHARHAFEHHLVAVGWRVIRDDICIRRVRL